jgi:hypothetical protein
VACGAIAGAAGSLVTGLMQGKTGMDLLKTTAFGALTGAAFGAAGPILGALARTGIGSRVVSAVSNSFIGRAGSAISNGIGRVTGAISNGIGRATSALGNTVRNGVNKIKSLFSRGCRPRHSFDPDTPVLMADGTTRPIKDITIGDTVAATDPETGVTAARPVTALHLNRDTELTDVTITITRPVESARSGLVPFAAAALAATVAVTTIVHTTQNHPFWDETTDTWVNAADLAPGHELRTDTGDVAIVTAVHNRTGSELMRDLTVSDTHTYYVLVGDTRVLVHNDNGVPLPEHFDVPDDYVIMIGGQKPPGERGDVFSGNMGRTSAEAGAGLPHNSVYETTAGEIRAAGGTVEWAPEETADGRVNRNHVNLTQGTRNPFGSNIANPASKVDRMTDGALEFCGGVDG